MHEIINHMKSSTTCQIIYQHGIIPEELNIMFILEGIITAHRLKCQVLGHIYLLQMSWGLCGACRRTKVKKNQIKKK